MFSFRAFFNLGRAALLAGLCLAWASAAPAQTATADQPENAAEALLKEGEALVWGLDPVAKDVAGGVAKLEQAIEAGNVKALIALGSLYLYGTELPRDLPRALALFERAAAQGDGAGLAEYGSALMWGEIDAKAAETALVRAGEMGVLKAWDTLAEGAMYGYLGGGKKSRAKYRAYADRALAEGSTHVAVLEANRLMWGILVTASGPQALAVLQAAADGGNAEAARYLIGLLRDGNRYNVRRAPEAARAQIERYRGLLSDSEAWAYEVTIAAAKARVPAAYAGVAEALAQHPERMNAWLGTELAKANQNVAVYLLQAKLAAAGLYDRAPDGMIGRAGLRAMNAYCADLSDPPACDDSVLRADVLGALIAE